MNTYLSLLCNASPSAETRPLGNLYWAPERADNEEGLKNDRKRKRKRGRSSAGRKTYTQAPTGSPSPAGASSPCLVFTSSGYTHGENPSEDMVLAL